MKLEKMAAVLAAADDDSRASLLGEYPFLRNTDLAHSLKSRFDEVKTTDPALARGALEALRSLERQCDSTRLTLFRLVTGLLLL